jgi:hypothetical protein
MLLSIKTVNHFRRCLFQSFSDLFLSLNIFGDFATFATFCIQNFCYSRIIKAYKLYIFKVLSSSSFYWFSWFSSYSCFFCFFCFSCFSCLSCFFCFSCLFISLSIISSYYTRLKFFIDICIRITVVDV